MYWIGLWREKPGQPGMQEMAPNLGESPTLSNVAGVVAAMKWGVILDIGEGTMKETITELIKKQERTMNDETKEKQELKVERRYLSMNVEARDGEEELAKPWKGMQPCSTLMQTWEALVETIEPGAFDAALIPAGCGSALQS